jgi:hypothetical protein
MAHLAEAEIAKWEKNYDSERQGMGQFSRPHYIFLSTSD